MYETECLYFLNPSDRSAKSRFAAASAHKLTASIRGDTPSPERWAQIAKDIPISFCRRSVNAQYIRDSFKEKKGQHAVDMIFQVMRRTKGRTRKMGAWLPHGFALCKFIEDAANEWGVYVDVVCAHQGTGTFLLTQLENLACEFGASFMQLSAIPNVINFYRNKLRYHHVKSCKSKPDEKLEKHAATVSNMRVNSSPQFYTFLRQLTTMGYSSRCRIPIQTDRGAQVPKCPAKDEDDVCNLTNAQWRGLQSKKLLSDTQYKNLLCERDGFVMRKCLKCHLKDVCGRHGCPGVAKNAPRQNRHSRRGSQRPAAAARRSRRRRKR